MGKRDSRYKLNGSIELDDAFFTISLEDDKKVGKPKRGRGSQRKAKVLVIAESQKSDKIDNRKKIQKSVGHIKMIVIEDFKKIRCNNFIEDISSNVKFPGLLITCGDAIIVSTPTDIFLEFWHEYNINNDYVRSYFAIISPVIPTFASG